MALFFEKEFASMEQNKNTPVLPKVFIEIDNENIIY